MQKKPSLAASARLFAPLYLPAFLFSFSNSLLTPVLPLYAQSFDITFGMIGVVLAGDSIGMLIGDLPAGLLLRRLGQKGSMLAGLLLSGFSTALIFWMPSIPMILFMRIVAGIGASLYNVSRHYFLVETTTSANRGQVISLFGGFYRFGRMLGPVVGGTVAAAFGLRASFLAFGAVCLLALAAVMLFLPHIEVSRHAAGQEKVNPLRYFARVIKAQRQSLTTAGAGFLLMQIIRSGPPVIIPLFAANMLGLDVATIGVVISVSAVLDMLMFFPAGIMMDRWGRKYAIISSCLLLAVGTALVPMTSSYFTLQLAALVAGLGGGLGSGVMLTLGSDLAPQEGRSEFLSAWTLIGDVGSTSGPLAMGVLTDMIPLAGTAWVIALGGVLAASVFGLLVPETLKRLPASEHPVELTP